MVALNPIPLSTEGFWSTTEGHPAAGTYEPDMLEKGAEQIPYLYRPVALRSGLTLKNRIIISPMCQYSSRDGNPSPWHIAHLGSFAIHGAGTIMVEASGVTAQGRITPQDLGIWSEELAVAHSGIVSSLKTITQGLTVGVQLAHAGRKASDWSPYHRGDKANKHWAAEKDGGWPNEVVGASPIGVNDGYLTPKPLTKEQIAEHVQAFVDAADRAFNTSKYDFVELHFAHGYLVHSFLSPLSNARTDEYGGSFENRTRFGLEIVRAVKKRHPNRSVWVRISATDFAEHLEAEGKKTWKLDEAIRFAKLLEEEGVDLIDVSAGGLAHQQKITPGPGYQLPFATEIRKNLPIIASASNSKSAPSPSSPQRLTHMAVGSVGMMHGPDADTGRLAEDAIHEDKADVVLLARGMMTNPRWAMEAGEHLTGVRPAGSPQYHRAHPFKSKPQNSN